MRGLLLGTLLLGLAGVGTVAARGFGTPSFAPGGDGGLATEVNWPLAAIAQIDGQIAVAKEEQAAIESEKRGLAGEFPVGVGGGGSSGSNAKAAVVFALSRQLDSAADKVVERLAELNDDRLTHSLRAAYRILEGCEGGTYVDPTTARFTRLEQRLKALESERQRLRKLLAKALAQNGKAHSN